jgi:hypothetical protein
MDLSEVLKQTVEFKFTSADGEETVLKQTFPNGTHAWDMVDMFKNFLTIIYSENIANKYLKTEEEIDE